VTIVPNKYQVAWLTLFIVSGKVQPSKVQQEVKVTRVLRILVVGADDIANYLTQHQVADTIHTNVSDEAIQTITEQDSGFDIVIIDVGMGSNSAKALLDAMKRRVPPTKMPGVFVRHNAPSCKIRRPHSREVTWWLQTSLQAHYPFARFHQTEANEIPWLCSILVEALPPATSRQLQ